MSTYRILSFSGSDPALKPYQAMIYSDFLKSLRYGCPFYHLIDSDCYYSLYKHRIDQMLGGNESVVRIAVLSDDPDTALGWSLSEGKRFHYAFVKLDFRRQGIGTSLLPKEFNQVTHVTKIGQAIREKKYSHVIFNPFF